MKKAEKTYIIVSLCAMLGWWGFFYPEFSLTPDNVNVIYEELSEEDAFLSPDLSSESLIELLMNAPREKVRFRSAFLKDMKSFWEVFSWK